MGKEILNIAFSLWHVQGLNFHLKIYNVKFNSDVLINYVSCWQYDRYYCILLLLYPVNVIKNLQYCHLS